MQQHSRHLGKEIGHLGRQGLSAFDLNLKRRLDRVDPAAETVLKSIEVPSVPSWRSELRQ